MARRAASATRLPVLRGTLTARVVLAPEALQTIRRLAPMSADGRETGGILLGHGPDNTGVIEIVAAGDPGPNADRRQGFFLRDLAHAQALAAAAWERERAQWVGEWHTHLFSGPQPSQRDLSTYASLLQNPALGFALFVALIVTPHEVQGWEEPAMTFWVLEARR